MQESDIKKEQIYAMSGISKELYLLKENMEKPVSIESLKWNDGWINATCVNVREKPSIKSTILSHLSFNERVEYYHVNDEWSCIIYNSDIAYVYSYYISYEEMKYKNYSILDTDGFKSFMSYRAITDKTSPQYKLQGISYTGNYGIRQVNNRYCIAVGTAFNAEIGTYIDIVLENGEIIPCIMGDVKSNQHTDTSNIFTLNNGCASEFIVDVKKLDSETKAYGNMSMCCEEWDSCIVSIYVYEENIFDN